MSSPPRPLKRLATQAFYGCHDGGSGCGGGGGGGGGDGGGGGGGDGAADDDADDAGDADLPPALRRCGRELRRKQLRQEQAARPFHAFAKQEAAVAFLLSQGASAGPGGLSLWAQELDGKGRRRFVATTSELAWEHVERGYRKATAHFYEVVTAGRPCHLYYDLEFKRAHNADADGDAMVAALLRRTAAALEEWLGATVERVADLDSSSEAKFSRHLTVVLRGAAFRSNAEVGLFVRRLASEIAADEAPDARAMSIVVAAADAACGAPAERGLFVDLAVYTRNRCFRCCASSKFGSDRVLKPRTSGGELLEPTRQLFLDALLCAVLPGSKLFECVSGFEDVAASYGRAAPRVAAGGAPQPRSSAPAASSPFPHIDEFIVAMGSRFGGDRAKIRAASYSEGPRTITYCMASNRYCARIGRQHRGNNVVYTVQLEDSGGYFWQSCFDPQCADWRSAARPLPDELRVAKGAVMDEADRFDGIDDAALLAC